MLPDRIFAASGADSTEDETETVTVTTYKGAPYTHKERAARPKGQGNGRQYGGFRNATLYFTPAAARAMEKVVFPISGDAVAVAQFGGLSYRNEDDEHPEHPIPDDARRHRINLRKRVGRDFPDAAAVWKLEYDSKQYPHFHLLLFGAGNMTEEWLSQAWMECTGRYTPIQALYGAYLRQVRDVDGARWYMTKPQIQYEQDNYIPFDHVGVYWGVWNRKKFTAYFGEEITRTMPKAEWALLDGKRLARAAAGPGTAAQRATRVAWVERLIKCRKPHSAYTYLNSLEEKKAN